MSLKQIILWLLALKDAVVNYQEKMMLQQMVLIS